MRPSNWIEMMKQTAAWIAVFLIVNPALTVPALAQVDVVPMDAPDNTPEITITTPNATTVNIDQGAVMRAIQNYSQFDVDNGETVNFIQPSELASILNRIESPVASASMIDGAINANGIVYFVNQSGVIFGANAMINVAQLFAAAGNITTENFLAGVNQFTEVNGPIENLGSITGDQVHLIGENVTIGPAGTINVPGGASGSIVTMVAGDDVIITVNGSNVAIVLNDALAGTPTGTGIEQAGTVDAGDGSVNMRVGDLYSMAVNHPGSTTAETVTIAGDSGTMDVGGITGGAGGIDVDSVGSLTVSDAIGTADATTGGASGGVTLSTTDGDINVNAVVSTGSASGGADVTSGSIEAAAGGSGRVLGTGSLETGNATSSGAGTAAVGDIDLSGDQITQVPGGNHFQVEFGSASGGTTNTSGVLSAATDANALFIASSSDLAIEDGGISTPGPINLIGNSISHVGAESGAADISTDSNLFLTTTEGISGIDVAGGNDDIGLLSLSVAGDTDVTVVPGDHFQAYAVTSTASAGTYDVSLSSEADTVELTNTGAALLITSANTADDDLSISSTSAGVDVVVGAMTVGGTAEVASSGSIVDDQADDGPTPGINITADAINLNAQDGIGSSFLETSTGSLSATTVDGDIEIHNDFDADVTVDELSTTGANAGSITYQQTGATNLTATTISTGDVSLEGGSSGDISVSTDGGNVDVAGTWSTGANTGVADATSGSISVTAGGDGTIAGAGSLDTGAASGSSSATVGGVDLAANSVGEGAAPLDVKLGAAAAPSVTQTGLAVDDDGVASGDVTVRSNVNPLFIDSIDSSGTVSIEALSIDDNAADDVTDISAPTIDLDATNGIGSSARLDVATASLSADTATGDVSLLNDGADLLVVSSLSSGGTGDIGLEHTGGGSTRLDSVSAADGSVEIANNDVTDPGLTGVLVNGLVEASDTVDIESSARIGDVTNNGRIHAPNVVLNAGTGITGEIDLQAQNIDAETGTGRINLNNESADPVVVSNMVTGTNPDDTGFVQFDQTGGGSVTFQNVRSATGNITLTNEADVVVDGTVRTGDVGGAETVTSGSISVSAAGSITDTPGSVIRTGDATGDDAAAGAATTGSITLLGSSIGSDTEPVSIFVGSASGALDNVDGALTATGTGGAGTAGAVWIDSDGPIDINTVMGGDVGILSDAAINDEQDDDATTRDADVIADGDVTLEGAGIGNLREIEIEGGASPDTGTLGLVANGAENVNVFVDDGFQSFDITSNGTDPHDIHVQLPGSDDIFLSSDGAVLTIGAVDPGDSSLIPVDTTEDQGAGAVVGDDVSITTSDTNMDVVAMTTGGGTVTLNSISGDIMDHTDDSASETIDITAAQVDLVSDLGIGETFGATGRTAQKLELSTSQLSATTRFPGIALDNTIASGDVTVTDLSVTGTGAVDFDLITLRQFGGDENSTLKLQSVSTNDVDFFGGSGGINIETEGRNIEVGDIKTGDVTGQAEATSGSVRLEAGGNGAIFGTGRVTTGVADGTILSKPGDITLIGNRISKNPGADDHLEVTFGAATTPGTPGILTAQTDGGAGSAGGIFIEGVDSDLWLADGSIDSGTGGTVDLIASGEINAVDGDDGEAEITSSAPYDVRLTADGIGTTDALQIHGEGPQSDGKTLTITSTGPGDINVDEIDNVMFDNLVVDAQTQDDKDYVIGLVGDGDQTMEHLAGALRIDAGGIDTSTNGRNVSIQQNLSDIVLQNGAIDTGAGNLVLTATDLADAGGHGAINSTADDQVAEIQSTGDVTLDANGIGNDSQIEISDGNANQDDSTLHVISQGSNAVDIEVLNNAFQVFQIDSTFPVPTTVDIDLPSTDGIELEANTAGDALVAQRVVTSQDTPNGDGGDVVNVAQDTTDVLIGFIDTGTQKAIIVSPGVIEDVFPGTDTVIPGDDGLVDIIASEVLLKANGGIGAINQIETQTGVLAAETQTGSIDVHNFGALEIGNVSGFDANGVFQDISGVTILGGDPNTDHIDISTASPLVVNTDVINNAGGNVTLTAGGGNTGDVTVNADVQTLNGDGDIEIFGDDDVDFTAAGDVFAEGSGSVLVVADADDQLSGVGGALTMDNGTVIDADTGRVDLRADENVTLGQVITASSDAGAVTLTSKSGAILDGGNTGGADVLAANGGLTIDAADGVGPDGNALDTQVAFLDGIDAGSGDINLSEADALTVRQLIQTDEGDIDLRAVGDLDLDPAGDITTGVGAGDIMAQSLGGALTMADGSVISSGIGTIFVGAEDDLTIGGLASENDTATAVSISTSANVVDGGDTDTDVLAADGGLDIDAGGAVGQGDAIETTVSRLAFTAAVSQAGDVGIVESDDLDVTFASTDQDGDLSIVTQNGDLRVTGGGVTASGNGSVTLQAQGGRSLNVQGEISNSQGAVNLLADDDVLFSAAGDVTTDGDVTVTADFDNQPDGEGGAVTMANGTVIDAGSGTISVSADEDITLGQLATSSASPNAVSLTSSSGGIVDGGDAGGVDVFANNGVLVIDAQTGIGSADAIETQVAVLDASNATSGDVAIRESDSLFVANLDQAGPGNIDLGAGGAVQTGPVTSAGGDILIAAGTGSEATLNVNDVVQSNGGDVDLNASFNVAFASTGDVTSSGGDVAVVADTNGNGSGGISMNNQALINAGSGKISLTADDNIGLGGLLTTSSAADAVRIQTNAAVSDNGQAFVDVNAASGGLVIESGTGVNDIETTVATLDVQNSTSGGIAINETDAVFVQRIAQGATGDVDLTAGGDISLGSISSPGDVNLSSTGGGIVDGGDEATDVVADALDMAALTGIGAADPIDVDVNSLTASIGGFGGSAPIRVSEANDVSVGAVSTAFFGTGPIEIDADGNLTVTGFVNSNDGPIQLSAGNDLSFAATGRTSSGNGDTVITADSDGVDGGGIDMDAASSVTTAFGTMTLRGTDDVTIAGLASTLGSVSVTSDAGRIVDGGDVTTDISSSSATLRAAAGIGDGNALDLAVGVLDAENSTSGNVDLSEADGVTVTNLVQGGPGDLRLVANNALTLAAAGSGVSATTGQVTLSGGLVNVNAGIDTTGGGVDLNSASNLNFGVGGDVSTQGGNVSADADAAIAMANGAVIDAGDGTIALDADGGSITLGRLVTTNATGSAVSLETSAAIFDGGDAEGVDVEAVNGRLTIDSVTGVGPDGNALEVNVAELDISNSGSGAINVNESDSVSIIEISNPGDPVTFSAGGDIGLGSITGSTVTLNSSGGGVFDEDGDDRNIDANTLIFDVATGFGTLPDPIDTRVGVFDGRSDTGDIAIKNTRNGGATITELVTGGDGGSGNVWFQQNDEGGYQEYEYGGEGVVGGVPGDLIVHHVDAASDGSAATGSITLENTSGRVVLKQDVMARGFGDLTLAGNDEPVEDDDPIDVVMDAPAGEAPDFDAQTIGSEQGDLIIKGDGVEKTNSGDMVLTGDTIELMPFHNERASQAPGQVVEDIFAGTGSGEGSTTQSIIHHQKGDILLNDDRGRPAGGAKPTIVAHGDLYVQDFIGGVKSQENEVIVANGDVEIRVENDVELPDTAAAGDIFVRTRVGTVYMLDDSTSASFITPTDEAVNYIADTIELDGANRGEQPQLPPGHPGLSDNARRPIFATTNGLPGVDPDTRAVVLTYDTAYDPREARLTGQAFPPFDDPIPPERDPATEIQAELGALMADELLSPVPGADVAAQRPLWADEVFAYLDCGLTPEAGTCAKDDPRLQTQAAVNARELYRRLFENEAAIRIWLEAEPQGPEAMHYRQGFEELFGYTDEMLTDAEQKRLRRMVLRQVAPEGTSNQELDELLQ